MYYALYVRKAWTTSDITDVNVIYRSSNKVIKNTMCDEYHIAI